MQLMISPKQQAYDWQTSSIHLVKSVSDIRNIATIILLSVFVSLLYRIVMSGRTRTNRHVPTSASSTTNQTSSTTTAATANIIAISARVHSPSHTLFTSLIFLVLPYIPASNLFITVGFVIAERLLYIPRYALYNTQFILSFLSVDFFPKTQVINHLEFWI